MRSEPKRNIDRHPLSRKPPKEDPLAAALHKLATAKEGQEARSAQGAIENALPDWTWDSEPDSGVSSSLSPAHIAQLVDAVQKGPNDPDALAAVERIRNLADEAVKTLPPVSTEWDFDLGKPTSGSLKPKWLVPDWIPNTGVGLLTGEDANGASHLALQLGARMAAGGGAWLGGGIANKMPKVDASEKNIVGFVQWEGHFLMAKHYLGQIDKTAEGALPLAYSVQDRLHHVDMSNHGPVWERSTGGSQAQTGLTATGRWLREYCENVRPKLQMPGAAAGIKLLILDPFTNAFGAAENASEEGADEDVARCIADWGEWASYRDCVVILCHHLGKDGHGDRDVSEWSAAADFHLHLSKDEEQNDQLVCLKTRYRPGPPSVPLHRDITTSWTWQEKFDSEEFRRRYESGLNEDR